MSQMTIKKTVDSVINELKRLDYKHSTIHKYEKFYANLLKYAEENNVITYSINFGTKYLIDEIGINPFYISSSSDNPYNKNHYFPIRACQCLIEWKLHQCIPLKKQGKLASQNLPKQFEYCYQSYVKFCNEAGYSNRGIYTRLNRIKRILIFFNTINVQDINKLTAENISSFFKTQIELDSRTVATILTTIRTFFFHLYQIGITETNYAEKLPNIKANRSYKLPKTWIKDDVLKILNSIDRGNPNGKRDYAILLIITRYGLRSADIKDLRLSCFKWDKNIIEINQSKTKKPLQLPIMKDIGWAIIDYLKHGRPKSDSPNVFLTNNVPYRPFGINSSALNAILSKHIRRSGVKISNKIPKGVHSLRHTLASTMLANDVPLPVISSVLGHSTQKATSNYLHIDIDRLKECALDPEVLINNEN
jgi:integrase/recombinase XerD